MDFLVLAVFVVVGLVVVGLVLGARSRAAGGSRRRSSADGYDAGWAGTTAGAATVDDDRRDHGGWFDGGTDGSGSDSGGGWGGGDGGGDSGGGSGGGDSGGGGGGGD